MADCPEKPVHDEQWADERFPDRGPAPSNEVVVEPDLPPAKNVSHPK